MDSEPAPSGQEAIEEEVTSGLLWERPSIGWHEIMGLNFVPRPVVREDQIPDFERWLFLNGFEDPDPHHQAFDFSAYRTTDGRIMLGLPPGTEVFSPFEGQVQEASQGDFDRQQDHDRALYQARVKVAHNVQFTLGTELAHVIPCVRPGEYVRKGQRVGVVHSSPGEEEGRLTHVHVVMGELYSGSHQARVPGPIDPAGVFLEKEVINGGDQAELERLTLPHTGYFFREELEAAGITTRFETLRYHILGPEDSPYRR